MKTLIVREFKDSKSIETKDNRRGQRSGTSSTDEDSISVGKRRNSKYSLNTESGRKNVLVLCLLVVCLVSNFNQNRDNLGKRRNLLNTDLDKILLENKHKLMEALDNEKDLSVGINEINPDYIDLKEIHSFEEKPHSIVKMNGLVPFVAKHLPMGKTQEDTLYDLCLKYANINTNKDCQCPEPFKGEVQAHPIRRFSKYLDEETRKGKPSIESITLSKHVTNTKALEKYKSGEEEHQTQEVNILDSEKTLKQLTGPNQQMTKGKHHLKSSLDNFEDRKMNLSSFKLPRSFTNLKSPFSDIMKKNVKKVKKEFVYKCHLNEGGNNMVNRFNLVLGKKSFDKLISEGTYSPSHFTTL
jgi:hypothetical protein